METSASIAADKLQLAPDISQAIRGESYAALKALPKRGAEIGGLLTSSGLDAFTADGMTLVPCEYLFGPSYSLSDRDLKALAESVEHSRADRRSVVAFFRSCTRSSVGVAAEDKTAIQRACPDVPFVVIAKPELDGSAAIYLFRRGPGDSWLGPESIEITVAPALQDPVNITVNHPASTAAGLASVAPGKLFAPAALTGKSRKWIWISAAAIILCGLAAWAIQRRSGRAEPASASDEKSGRQAQLNAVPAPAGQITSQASGLSLRVQREGSTFRVTWDRNSRAAQHASSSSLDIKDGAAWKSIPLSLQELTNGSIMYSSRSSDITFRLQTKGSPDSSADEIVRVLGVTSIPLTPPVTRAAATVQNPASTAASALPAKAPPSEVPAGTTALRNEAAFTPPPVSALPNRQVTDELPPPPLVGSRMPQTAAAPLSSLNTLTLPPKAAPSTPGPVNSAPALSSDSQTRAASREDSVLPPQPIRQVLPINHGNSNIANPAWSVHSPVTVGIIVSVDEKGRVRDARAAPGNAGVSQFLIGESIDAARQWRFKPASRNGTPVPAEHIIQFRFRPPSEK